MTRPIRMAGRACSALVATAAMALVVAPAALAHATLVSSTPSDGAVLARAPKQVVLAFNEPVESALGSVRVYDGRLDRVDDGATTKPEPNEVAVGLRSGLPRGTYTVAWRVISADSHPVHGAFVFSVGQPSAGGAGVVEQVLAGQAGSKDVDLVFGVIRFLNLALILLCAGGAIVLAWVLKAEHASVGRPLWPVLSVAALLLALVSVAGIGLEGAQASGLGLGSALRPSLFGDVVDTRFGRVWLVRAGLALAFALLAALALRRERQRSAFAWYAVALGAALALTPALSGHARVEGTLGVVSDWVHVLAASAWTGGLAFVLLALLLASGDRWELARRIVPRFSALAVISVALLLIAGVVSGFLEVRTWSGLWSTTYGQLLLVKVALVVPLLCLGLFNNRISVPRLRSGAASAREQRHFLATVGVELAVMVVIVGVTAALVAETPAKAQQSVSAGPVSRDVSVGPFDLDVLVDPARTGPNAIHITVLQRATGQLADVDEIRVAASLPAAGLGPLRFKTTPAGPGHVIVSGATFPVAGDWKLEVDVRRGEFDQWSTTLDIPIGKD